MNLSTKVLAATFISAAMFCAPTAFGQSCGLHDSPISCANKEAQAAANQKAFMEAVKAKAEFNQEIAAARAQFWATYPAKPGAEAAREKFAELLREKDMYYLILAQYSQGMDPTQQAGQGVIGNMLDQYVGGVPLDGGIPQSAKPELSDWTQAFAKNLAAAGGLFTPQAPANTFKALTASQKEYDRYILERDWAEFDALNRVPVAYEAPRNYAAMLYFRFGKLPLETAFETVASMVKLLGPEAVDSAAQQVKDAPKTRAGTLVVTTPEPVKIGPGGNKLPDDTIPAAPNVIGSFGGSLSAFEALATRGDDRRYLLAMIAENSATERNQSIYIGEWDRAATSYNRYVFAFGEPEVIEVSHQVRVAVKRMTDGWVMHPEALGSTRMTPYSAFEDVLARKDPRGYVRSMLAFKRNLNSKADVDAAYRDFMTGKNEAAVIETAGKMAAGRPELALDFDTLTGALNGSISVDKPVQAMVDYWGYVAWKGFSPNAQASYLFRLLAPDRPGSANLVPGPTMVRQTFKLQSITDALTTLWKTEIAYDNPGGTAHPPSDTEVAYTPKAPAPVANPRVSVTVENGEETLDIKGKKLSTRWQSVKETSGNCTMTTKTWISDAVPGGMVRKIAQNSCAATFETILDSFEGTRQPGFADIFEARADSAAGGAGAPSAPVNPPPVSGRAAPSKGAQPSASAPAPLPPLNPDYTDPELPNYYLSDHDIEQYVLKNCSGLYNTPQPLLSPAQIQLFYKNQAIVTADVQRCVSWFNDRQIRVQRKLAMRYCLINNNFHAMGQAQKRAGYDACMNQNDMLTALCSQDSVVRQQLEKERLPSQRAAPWVLCPGFDQASPREVAVVTLGGNEDVGRPMVVSAPGLPPLLQSVLPTGFLRGGAPLGEQPPSPSPASTPFPPKELFPNPAPSIQATQTPPIQADTRSTALPATNGRPVAVDAPSSAAAAPVAPAPGTTVEVRMIETVDSSRDPAGKQYRATVTKAVNAGNNLTIPQGAVATVTLARNGTNWVARLSSLIINGQTFAVSSSSATVTSAAQDTAAAVNNAIGGIFGRKPNLAPATQSVAMGDRVILPPGARVTFILAAIP